MPSSNSVYTAKSLVDEKILLDVPIYQRLFVWDEVQILALLNDIYDARQKKSPNYYIGIVTVVERQETDSAPRWELVDGQQRLTFLTLLGTQVKLESGWNDFVVPTENELGLRINYTGRQKDQDSIKALMKETPEECKNPNMLRFLKCYQEFLAEKKLSASDIAEFADYAYTRTAFLVSKLPTSYTPFELNTYFEKLNATGRQLEPEELVKGLYFASEAAEWNTLCDFSKRFSPQLSGETNSSVQEPDSTTIRRILETADSEANAEVLKKSDDKAEPPSSIRSILSLPVFLLHVLNLLKGRNVEMNPRKLVQIFKENAPTSKEVKEDADTDTGTFMQHMSQYRKWLDNNIVHHTADGLEFWRGENMDDQTEPTNDRKALRQFQSMLAVSSSEQQRWVLEAYRNASEKNLCDADFLIQLKKEDLDRNPLPGEDAAFKVALRYPAVNRYWFWRLDYVLWELAQNRKSTDSDIFSGLDEKELAAIRAYRFKPNRSIEHLHPQTSSEPWVPEILHAFGNLAMISASFNSAQSNDGIGTKFGRVKDQIAGRGALESIKMLLMFKAADRNENNWNTVLAEQHEAKMIELLREHAQNISNS
jgi:hypothetical protein